MRFARPGSLAIYVTPNGPYTDPLDYGEDSTVEEALSKRLPRALCFRAEDIDDVCDFAAVQAEKFRVGLCIDEAHEVFPEGFSPASAAGQLFHRGRHLGIHLIVVSQWPARLDKRLFRAAELTYWFRLHAHEDLKWIRKRWGLRAAQDIAGLRDRTFLRVAWDNLPPGWRMYGAPAAGENFPDTPDSSPIVRGDSEDA